MCRRKYDFKTGRYVLAFAAVLLACSAQPGDAPLRRTTTAIAAYRPHCLTPEPGTRPAPPIDPVAAKVKPGVVPQSVKAAGKVAIKRDHAEPGPMPTQTLDRQLKRADYLSELKKLKAKVADPGKFEVAAAELKSKMLGD